MSYNCDDDPYNYDSDYYDESYDYDNPVDDDEIINSDDLNSSEENSMAAQVGQQFTTGNSTVRNLKPGTILEVVGPGALEIVEVPVVNFNEGDRIFTKHGASTVVRLSSRFDELVPFDAETQVLYVADSGDVVRKANKSDVSAI